MTNLRLLLSRAVAALRWLGLPNRAPATAPAPPDALHRRFFALLRQGYSVYARKQGYGSFARALLYYDRAQCLADQA